MVTLSSVKDKYGIGPTSLPNAWALFTSLHNAWEAEGQANRPGLPPKQIRSPLWESLARLALHGAIRVWAKLGFLRAGGGYRGTRLVLTSRPQRCVCVLLCARGTATSRFGPSHPPPLNTRWQ